MWYFNGDRWEQVSILRTYGNMAYILHDTGCKSWVQKSNLKEEL